MDKSELMRLYRELEELRDEIAERRIRFLEAREYLDADKLYREIVGIMKAIEVVEKYVKQGRSN